MCYLFVSQYIQSQVTPTSLPAYFRLYSTARHTRDARTGVVNTIYRGVLQQATTTETRNGDAVRQIMTSLTAWTNMTVVGTGRKEAIV